MGKRKLVQLQNPRTKTWIIIDTETGTIREHTKTSEPKKGILIKGKVYDRINPQGRLL